MLTPEEKELTVEQFIKQKGLVGKAWTCPHLLSNGKIGNPEYFYGVECAINNIPKEILPKKMSNYFREGGFHCIVWYNDEDYVYEELLNKM